MGGIGDFFKDAAPVIGTAVGAYFGGPAGAAVGGSIGSAISGQDAVKASGNASIDAANIQAQAAERARQESERLNKPYYELGVNNMPGYSAMLGDPAYNTFDILQKDKYGYNYLSGNPLFKAAINNATRAITAQGAAGGRYNSGGLVDQLFQNYLSTGDAFWGNYLNRRDALANTAQQRAYQPIALGQASANNQAVNAGNLIVGAGDALAAGQIGQANARAAGSNGWANAAGNVAGIFASNPNIGSSIADTVSGWFGGGSDPYNIGVDMSSTWSF